MKLYLPIFLLFSSLSLAAQPFFPSLSGQELIDALGQEFRPGVVLDYGDARDELYGVIDRRNDSLYCVYTDLGVQLTPGADPSTDAFENGLNTEHTWPQSKGAGDGNPRSDMHHLFSTQLDVNSDRGSLPFGEVSDNQTSTWYYLTQEQSSVPPANVRDRYSELLGGARFEPREAHKGNVARAMFYFYTVYRAEADAADPNYFQPQIDDLCDWHLSDPVDQRELDRTEAIALFQDGKVNPFVVDCNLLARTYCPDQMSTTACISDVNIPEIPAPFEILGVGNDGSSSFVMLNISRPVRLKVDWYDTLGRKVSMNSQDWVSEGTFQLVLNSKVASLVKGSSPLIGRISVQDGDGRWFWGSVVL